MSSKTKVTLHQGVLTAWLTQGWVRSALRPESPRCIQQRASSCHPHLQGWRCGCLQGQRPLGMLGVTWRGVGARAQVANRMLLLCVSRLLPRALLPPQHWSKAR
jgi:hypothetical protein